MEGYSSSGRSVTPIMTGVVCSSVAEVCWGWEQGPAAAGPGTGWDGVGLVEGTESREGCSSTGLFCCFQSLIYSYYLN